MGMTLAQLRTLVQANVNRPDKTVVVDAGLNFGLDELTRRHTFKGRRSEVPVAIATGDTSVSVPEGMTNVSNLRLQNSDASVVSTICFKAKNVLLRQFPQLTIANIQGMPAYAYEEAGQIFFFPEASQEYTLLVTGDSQGGFLAAETDTVGIDGIDEALVAYATAYVFRSIQQNEEAGIWGANFERLAVTAIRNDNRRSGEERQLEGFPGPPKGYNSDPTTDPFFGIIKR